MTIAAISPRFSDAEVRTHKTEAQRLALRAIEPEVCYSGRRFGGKSWIGCAKAWLYANRYPGARVALCREERASMESTTLLTLRNEIVDPATWAACWRDGKSVLTLPNKSEIHAFGLDKPGRALGARYGLAVIDQAEQISLAQFEVINSCVMQLGMPFCQTMLLFNPEDPGHWAYRRYQPDDGDGVRVDKHGKVFARVVHVQPSDLIDLLSDTSRERFDRMAGVWRDRLRLGKWVAFEGAVFDGWDPAVHMVEPPCEWAMWGGSGLHGLDWTFPPPDWTRYRGIDFGYEPDPYTCQWWAESPQGVRYMYRQTYHTRKTIEAQADEINALEREELETLKAAVVKHEIKGFDPYLDGLNIAASLSDHHRGERAMLEDRGVWSLPADKDILAGIETVRDLMTIGEGGPRLCIVRSRLHERDPRLADQMRPTSVEEEIASYRWRTVSEGSQVGRAKTLPVDKDNHGIDAMRYVHHSLAGMGGVRVVA